MLIRVRLFILCQFLDRRGFMEIGMLWFDNDEKVDLMERIDRAVKYFYKKYGKFPNICYLHPSMINDKNKELEGIQLETRKSIVPYHYWLCIIEKR